MKINKTTYKLAESFGISIVEKGERLNLEYKGQVIISWFNGIEALHCQRGRFFIGSNKQLKAYLRELNAYIKVEENR